MKRLLTGAALLALVACQPRGDEAPGPAEVVAQGCDTTVAVGYGLEPSATGAAVRTATVTGLATACDSAGLRVTVGEGSVDLATGGPVAIEGTSATVTFSTPVPASDVEVVSVAIGTDGPPPALCATQAYARRVVGGIGPDRLTGGNRRELALGFGGADTVRGGAGGDCLVGGAGNDLLEGGDGADRIDGGPGRDTCRGQGGVDQFRDCEVRRP